MPQNNSLQKDELILPGGLGEVTVASTGQRLEIIQTESDFRKGSLTLTLKPITMEEKKKNPFQEAIDFWKNKEIVETGEGSFKTNDGTEIGVRTTRWKDVTPKTEDIPCEIIQPKQLNDGTI